MSLSRETLLDFLSRRQGIDVTDIDEDSPLFSAGLLDSFGMLDLVLLVESQCGFKVQPVDLNLNNFDSVGHILAFADSRTEKKDATGE